MHTQYWYVYSLIDEGIIKFIQIVVADNSWSNLFLVSITRLINKRLSR